MSEGFEKVMSEVENIRVQRDGNIVVITMNRPKALNALNDQTLEELDRVFTCLEEEREVLGVIITGEGKGFVAGADISQMQSYKSEEGRNYADRAQTLFNKIEALEKPVIAAVNGYALGGGCELSMSCDIRIAVMDAEDNIYTLPPENVDPETGEVIDELSEEEMRQFDGDIDETLPTVSKILAGSPPTTHSDDALVKEIASVIDDTPVTGAKNAASMPEDEDEPDMSAFDMDALCILSELFDNELELR